MTVEARVMDALAGVHDPELDEPITTLRFVSSCVVTPDGVVRVALRLPTPQCAPNFAFLMGADARRAIARLPGVRSVHVTLEDHYTGEEINAALHRGEGFMGAFPGETGDDDLEALRALFQRKALIARQSVVCEAMLATGDDADGVLGRRVSDLPPTPEARRSLELREALGLPCDADAPAFVLADGQALTAAELPRWRRMARLVRTSLEANGGICRSLLQIRHNLASEPGAVPTTDPEEVAR
ncbi:MAG TPA: iron-sulfur cluster assembly protein [Solirubrobacteraceae bacterium]